MYLLNALRATRPGTGLGKIMRIISLIKKAVVIMAFAAQDLKALSQALGSIQPIFLLKIIMIGRLEAMTKT